MVKMTSLEEIPLQPNSVLSAGEESSDFVVLSRAPSVDTSLHASSSLSLGGLHMSSILSANSDMTPEEVNYRLKELISGNIALKDALQRSNRLMHEELSTVAAWRAQMIQTNNRLQELLGDAQEKIKKLQDENEALQHKETSSLAKSSDRSCVQLEKEENKFQNGNQCSVLENKVLAQQEEISALQNANKSLSSELEKQQTSQQQLQKNVDDIAFQLGSLQSNSETLELEKRELTALNNELTTQLSNLSLGQRKRRRTQAQATVFCDDESGYAIVFPPDEQAQNKEFDGDGLQGALLELHEEKLKVDQLTQELAQERAQVACVKQLLDQKNYQVDVLLSRMPAQKHEAVHDVDKAAAQISTHENGSNFPLCHDAELLQSSVPLFTCHGQGIKDKCDDFQLILEKYREKLEKLEATDAAVINQLRQEVKNVQEILREERHMFQEDRQKFFELSQKLEHVTKNYNALLARVRSQTDEQKSKTSESGEEKEKERRLHQEQLDCLTARLMNAQQQLEVEEHKVHLLKMEIGRLEKDTENIPILKAQVELYKGDFENEKKACESAKSEIEKLRKEALKQSWFPKMARTHVYKKEKSFGASSGESHHRPRGLHGAQGEHASPVEDFPCPWCLQRFPEFFDLSEHATHCSEHPGS